LVDQSVREHAAGASGPFSGTGFPLLAKLLLALASITAYALVSKLAESVEAIEFLPEPALWFHYVVGAVFGALVLGPYVGPRQRGLRFVALCVAGSLTYWLAVRFVTDGPIGYGATTSFVIAGAAAAVLSGLAVAVISPRAYAVPVFALTLVAGMAGGVSFEIKIATDQFLLVSHAIWQLLVCLALHLGFRERRPA
jgi:hypothetical protein